MSEPLAEGYYLLNFEAVLDEVCSRYGDLLAEEERVRIEAFLALPLNARRLYVRMLTRKGPWFREDGLAYPEIGPEAVRSLCKAGFCTDEAALKELLPLLVKPELAAWLQRFGIPCAKAERREAMTELLVGHAEPGALTLALRESLRPVKPLHTELWDLLFFLFFGNGEQDLSSFVLADTGRVVHERYAIDPGNRLFESRRDVDFLLSAGALRAELEQTVANGDRVAMDVLTERVLAVEPHPGVRQQRRYHRLLNALGQAWERANEPARALECFGRSRLPPARERVVRLMAKSERLPSACRLAAEMAAAPLDVGEGRFARVFFRRHAGRSTEAARWLTDHPAPERMPEVRLLAARQGSVELAALAVAREQGWEGFFTENVLWNALFGLIFWDILFAPVPGAFQHRFQNAPADLGQPGFFERRKALIEERLEALRAPGAVGHRVLGTYDDKRGVANAFLAWQHLGRELLEAAVRCVPPAVLDPVLRTMARSPRTFSSGFPDLFLFQPQSGAWALWEVKGPGDSLRPEQERWLRQFRALGCDARVAWVRYHTE